MEEAKRKISPWSEEVAWKDKNVRFGWEQN